MSFDNWLNGVEGFNSRLERAYEELVLHRYNDNHSFWKTILSWLQSSYNTGLDEQNNIINSLKQEIKTQRTEIAALREERRFLLNKDKVPEIGYQE